METRLFLVELQNRPDGIINQTINSYSTPAVTMSMFYQRCAAACASTQFTSVSLVVMDQYANIMECKNIVAAYTPPEPEAEPEEQGAGE